MANTLLIQGKVNTGLIAREGLAHLENNLVMGKLVHRDYDIPNTVNSYKTGDSITIKRPVRFTVREGAVASNQDVVEGSTALTVGTQKGVDFGFTSRELTLDVKKFSEDHIKPAMITLANKIDMDLYALYSAVPNWVGTPGQLVNSFTDFAVGPQRMDELAVPGEMRNATLSPADYWAMVGSFTNLAAQAETAETALRRAKLGRIGQVDTYQAQNVMTHTVGTKAGTPLIAGAAQNVTYLASKDTGTQTLNTDGWTASSAILKKGDVFTIANVFAVNPVTKAVQTFLRQFTVVNDISADGAGLAAIVIRPAIITSGAYQTCSVVPADNAVITVLGSASTGYAQNMVFHKNAFALAMVPMEIPPGSVEAHRETYKGLSVRVIPYYDGTNDVSNIRFDMMYAVGAIYPDLAVRLSGTA